MNLVQKNRFSSSGNLSRSSTNPLAWMTVLKPAKLLEFELRQKLFSNVIWPELLRTAPKSRRTELNASGPKTNRLRLLRAARPLRRRLRPRPIKTWVEKGQCSYWRTSDYLRNFTTSRTVASHESLICLPTSNGRGTSGAPKHVIRSVISSVHDK